MPLIRSIRAGLLLLALGLSAPAIAADGTVEGVVFDGEGAPVANVELSFGGVTVRTDVDGAFRLPLDPGEKPFSLEGVPLAPVSVVDGQVTELLITLPGGGAPPVVRAEVPDEGLAVPDEVADPGILRGTITHAEEGTPVAGARIFARGASNDAVTDAKGVFELELPGGPWDLSIVKSGFATRTLTAVEVLPDDTVAIQVELLPAGVELDDFVITAPAIVGGTADLLEERRDSSAVADVLGAEQMARSGDSNAASALRRVTGLTVVGGRYVYVRGLGERYSSTLLNGATLPSPEPERRVVPLDLFPTGVLESVVIQKTFSPNMPAEFGGGTIQLRTRRAPAQPFFNIGTSGTWNSQTTWQRGLTSQGGPTDWLGMDNGFRALPTSVQNASDNSPLEESDMFSNTGYTAEQLEEFGEAMPNRWKIKRRKIPLSYGISSAAGTKLEVGKHTFGLLAGASYSDGWEKDLFHRDFTGVAGGGELVAKHRYDFELLNRRVKLGGLVTASWQLGEDHEIMALGLLSRITDDESRLYEGYNDDVQSDIRVSRIRWVERALITRQLIGNHRFFGEYGIEATWRATLSNAGRIEPDRRETRYDAEENVQDVWLLSDRPEGNQRFFSTLEDENLDLGVDLVKPIKLTDKQALRLGAGGVYMDKSRTVDTRRFKYMHKGERSRLDEVLSQVDNPELVFAPENIGPDGFQFEEITRQTDNYGAVHRITSVYGMVDVDLTPSTRIMGGARMEDSTQKVLTYELFNPDSVPVEASLVKNDLLPAVTLTQGLPADMQVRAGYGKTVNRPDFREMSPATFNDVTGGRQTFGNPDLKRATIDNFDLRWEWYPEPGESISLAGFRKVFDSPIEQIVISSAQESVTYANAKSATNIGIEFDWRKGFGFIDDAIQDLYIAGNVALIDSQVKIGQQDNAVQSNNQRALQGQSPYAVNLQLGWDDVEGRYNCALLYNKFGRRITEAGSQGAPDAFEESYATVDLVGSVGLPGGFRLGLKAQNLTDPAQNRTQGKLTTEENSAGRTISANLRWETTKKE